jgi:hypothetical protein
MALTCTEAAPCWRGLVTQRFTERTVSELVASKRRENRKIGILSPELAYDAKYFGGDEVAAEDGIYWIGCERGQRVIASRFAPAGRRGSGGSG